MQSRNLPSLPYVAVRTLPYVAVRAEIPRLSPQLAVADVRLPRPQRASRLAVAQLQPATLDSADALATHGPRTALDDDSAQGSCVAEFTGWGCILHPSTGLPWASCDADAPSEDWVPDSYTLPTTEQPVRVAEFDRSSPSPCSAPIARRARDWSRCWTPAPRRPPESWPPVSPGTARCPPSPSSHHHRALDAHRGPR